MAGMPGSQLCLKMFVQGSRVRPSSLRPGLCGSCGLLAFLPPCGPLCSSPCVWGEFQKQLARDVFGSEPPTVAAPERGRIATRFPEPGSLPKTLSPHVSPVVLSASRPSRHPGIGLCTGVNECHAWRADAVCPRTLPDARGLGRASQSRLLRVGSRRPAVGVPTSASTVRLREAPGRKGAACPPPSPPSAHPLTHAAQLLALPRQSEPSAVVSLTRGAGEQEAAPLLLCLSPLHCCLLHPLECAPRSGGTQPVSTSLHSAGPRGPGACAHALKHTHTRAHRGTHTH